MNDWVRVSLGDTVRVPEGLFVGLAEGVPVGVELGVGLCVGVWVGEPAAGQASTNIARR